MKTALNQLYDTLPKVSSKIRERMLRFAGHVLRSDGETVSEVKLWTPKHGPRRPVRQQPTFNDIVRQDTELEGDDIRISIAMQNRSVWRTVMIGGKDSTRPLTLLYSDCTKG